MKHRYFINTAKGALNADALCTASGQVVYIATDVNGRAFSGSSIWYQCNGNFDVRKRSVHFSELADSDIGDNQEEWRLDSHFKEVTLEEIRQGLYPLALAFDKQNGFSKREPCEYCTETFCVCKGEQRDSYVSFLKNKRSNK